MNSRYVIFAKAKTYNPYRSYPANYDRYCRHYDANTLEEIELVKAKVIAKGETITGIYTNTGKRIG